MTATASIREDRSIPGVRVVTEELPWCHTAVVGVWISAGSTAEGPGEHGAAHFLEHVLFKRTSTSSGREISERVDLLGGDLNAFTDREHTCYHVQAPAEGIGTAVDVLVDVVADGSFDPEDVEVERDVVLDELAGRADDPEDLACELVTSAVLGADPLARPVIGTEEAVEVLGADTLASFHRRVLRAGDVVVAASGRIDHDDLVRRIADGPLAAAVRQGTSGSPRHTSADPGWVATPTLVGEHVDGEQAFLSLSRRSPARRHRDRAAAQIGAAVLGGGLSSRLFQRVREELGLSYSVYATVDQFRPTGLVSVVAGSPVDRMDALFEAVGGVVDGMIERPPTVGEIERAAGHLTGSIRSGLDDPLSRMTRIGRHMLDRDAVVPVEESVRRLRAVTRDEVVGYWASESAPWCLAVVGPGMPAGSGADDLLGSVGR